LSNGVFSVKSILDFILPENDISVSIIEKAYNQSSADKMRRKEKANSIEGFSKFGVDVDYLKVRKAVSGSYLNEMSAEDIEFCNRIMEGKVTFLNYN